MSQQKEGQLAAEGENMQIKHATIYFEIYRKKMK